MHYRVLPVGPMDSDQLMGFCIVVGERLRELRSQSFDEMFSEVILWPVANAVGFRNLIVMQNEKERVVTGRQDNAHSHSNQAIHSRSITLTTVVHKRLVCYNHSLPCKIDGVLFNWSLIKRSKLLLLVLFCQKWSLCECLCVWLRLESAVCLAIVVWES